MRCQAETLAATDEASPRPLAMTEGRRKQEQGEADDEGLRAVSTVLESGADDGTKEDAFAQAKEELNRELGQEGPNALKIDFGYM